MTNTTDRTGPPGEPLTGQFNEASRSPDRVDPDIPKPSLELRPPENLRAGPIPPGPGGCPPVSPYLRAEEPAPEQPPSPLLKKQFNQEASKGYPTSRFNWKARPRDNGRDHER